MKVDTPHTNGGVRPPINGVESTVEALGAARNNEGNLP